MLKKIFFSGLILMVLLTGCTSKNAQNQVTSEQFNKMKENFNTEIARLETKINNNNQQIQETINGLSSSEDFRYWDLETKNQMVDILVKHLPEITHEQGYIKNVGQDEKGLFFMVDDAKWISVTDGSSPSGFKILNSNEGYVKIRAFDDAKVYVRDGTMLRGSTLIKQFNEDINRYLYNPFFDLYLINEKIVLVVEPYRP